MTDDIVTRLRRDVDAVTYRAGVEPKGMISIEAADEIERLRALLDNVLERENKYNAIQLQMVRKVESDRNRWRATAEVLARELGKVEYANAEYENQEGLH